MPIVDNSTIRPNTGAAAWWILAGVALAVGLFFAWQAAAAARVRTAVVANNAIAATARAELVTSLEGGHLVIVGELRSHLTTSQDEARELLERNGFLLERNTDLDRELSTAQQSVATLELELVSRPTEVAVVDGELTAEFEGVEVSNGDTLGYRADLVVPLDELEQAELRVVLFGRLTVNTQFQWEGETPICQVSVRHAAVSAVPGICVEVLGTRPLERAQARIDLALFSFPVLPVVAGVSAAAGFVVGWIAR